MALKLSNAVALLKADAAVDSLDAGAGAGKLLIYAGSEPAEATTALTTQTLLATITLPDPAFGAAIDAAPGATATANAIDPAIPTGTGTASFYRAVDSDDNVKWQGTVGTAGSGEQLELTDVELSPSYSVAVASWTYTQPES